MDYLLAARGLSHTADSGTYATWSLDHGVYSDVIRLGLAHYIHAGQVVRPLPYLHDRIEYPVLLGFALWLPTWLPGGPASWLAATGVMTAAATFGSIALLRRHHPPSAWWIAASPALLLDAAINWDLIGVVLLVGAVVWFGERRYGWSGGSTAAGTCFKLFPVVVAPMALAALGGRWWRSHGATVPEHQPDGGRSAPSRDLASWLIPFAVVLAVVTVPFMVLAPSNTVWFYRFNSLRPQKDSLWGLLGAVTGVGNSTVNSLSLLAVTAVVAYGAWRVWRTLPDSQGRAVALASASAVIVWMAVNKVWNPQYILWVFAAGGIVGDAGPVRSGPRGPVHLRLVVRVRAPPTRSSRHPHRRRGRRHGRPTGGPDLDGELDHRSTAWPRHRGGRFRPRGDPHTGRLVIRSDARPELTVSAGPNPAALRPRAASWIRTHPGMTVALFVPLVVTGTAQLFGMTFLSGDNFIQNFPMRVLVGRDLSHGVLPLWNPYLFSGTPLLGGFNAGAAYPATWLTAFLPIFTAWTLTLALTYDVALAGMYTFLRRQGVGSTAATFGAVTFALAGYMTAQVVHVDLIEGAAWLPWILVAAHGLTVPLPAGGCDGPGKASPRGRLRWALLLGVSLGLTLLAGAAEAIIDSGVLVGIYWIWRLASGGFFRRRSGRALAVSVGATIGGLAAGVALGTAQWLPGLLFLSQSQRATASYGFFTSGSLDNRLLTLVASPFVLGTNQGWPATYAGAYNFPEVTSYVGVLALIAACCLLLRRWRTRPEARQWWIWYVILAVGVLSSLGNQTPFARLMYLIPGVRSERLLNRNLLLVDVALAVLLAWWVHLTLEDRSAPSGGARSRSPSGSDGVPGAGPSWWSPPSLWPS